MTTYEEIKELLTDDALPMCGISEEREAFIVQAGQNEYGKFFKVITAQNNGWCRINYYYEDGSIEETYEK